MGFTDTGTLGSREPPTHSQLQMPTVLRDIALLTNSVSGHVRRPQYHHPRELLSEAGNTMQRPSGGLPYPPVLMAIRTGGTTP